MRIWKMAPVAIAFGLVAAGRVSAQTAYTLEPIVVEFPWSACTALNDSGQVVGSGGERFGAVRTPFIWTGGATSSLPHPPGIENTQATAVDNQGRVYGWYRYAERSFRIRVPVRWIGGLVSELPSTFRDVSTFGPTSSPSGAFLVIEQQPFDNPTQGWRNENGWEEERDFTADNGDPTRAFLLNGTSRVTVGKWPTSVHPTGVDVNEAGQVVGRVGLGGWNHTQAYRWDAERGAVLLGTLGGRSSRAVAINDAGQIVGVSEFTKRTSTTIDYRQRAFLWEAGAMRDLGVLPGFAGAAPADINDAGVVVGHLNATDNPFQADAAFVWRNGTMVVLDDLIPSGAGWNLTRAVAINTSGQILAAERIGPGFQDERFALLTPAP